MKGCATARAHAHLQAHKTHLKWAEAGVLLAVACGSDQGLKLLQALRQLYKTGSSQR
jgi:hypothetical protein